MALRRGEIRPYQPVLQRPGQSLLRLIVSVDALNDTPLPIVHGLQIVEHDPGTLLSVQLEGHGWAIATTIEQVVKRRLGDVVDTASPSEMEAVDRALRAMLGL